ncbi:arylsulfotransferase family protein [Cellulophaga sp. Asnod2-G02]|uniref:arylsulfotransferase family protein n=1 Tax=Cellulophaga sp. Asnod2-G02 TaxID=3160572 RepID=UPI003864CA09
MKYISTFSILILLLLVGCKKDTEMEPIVPVEEIEDIDTDVILELSENIEIYDAELVSDDLVLVIENGGKSAYFLNKEGVQLYTWDFELNLGNDLQLLPTGQILAIFKSEAPSFTFGGYGGVIQIINPDSSIAWEFIYSSEDYIAHHDIEILPNGNILILAWERISMETATSFGVFVDHDLYPEKLIEVDFETKDIVWEWRAWDHIIQDVNAGFDSFAAISEYPNKIDINYYDEPNGDIMHANAIEYDISKDIIYLSVNYYNEVWVLDHSTTTFEASGAVGGNYNLGGDLVYRFGNPEAYDNLKGNTILDRNHFPNIIAEGLPGEGNLMIYNNGRTSGQSTVYELEMPKVFNLQANTDNEPAIVWGFTNADLFSERVSGAVRLLNGNTLICEGDYGFWEVTVEGEIVWKYKKEGSFWRGYSFGTNNPILPILGI